MAALTLELENYDEEMDTMACDAINGRQGPLILLGGFPETTVGDLLQDLPSRPVADRLVTKFFQLEEPSWSEFSLGSNREIAPNSYHQR